MVVHHSGTSFDKLIVWELNPPNVAPISTLTVYYNTRCPVCDAGIDWQRSKLVEAVRAGTISFRDINWESGVLADYGVNIDDVRRRLHALVAT